MKVIVISEQEKFEKDKIAHGLQVNKEDILRIDPVFTDETCVNGTRGETGCFKAHQKAWQLCGMQEGEKCMVLERDWTIGNLDPSEVHKRIESGAQNENDYHLLGHCDSFFCGHAYIVKKDLATKMAEIDVCDAQHAVDVYMNFKCLGEEISCGREEHPTMPGCFGEGVIQQDRVTTSGMHDAHNKMNAEYK